MLISYRSPVVIICYNDSKTVDPTVNEVAMKTNKKKITA